MVSLTICAEAEDELDRLYEADEDAAALIDTLLAELAENDGMLSTLFRPGNHFRFTPPFETKMFGEAQKRGKNIFTLKVRDEVGALLPYRVLFAHNAQSDAFHVLAIALRNDAYDPDKPGFRDLLVRYDECGIPTYKY